MKFLPNKTPKKRIKTSYPSNSSLVDFARSATQLVVLWILGSCRANSSPRFLLLIRGVLILGLLEGSSPVYSSVRFLFALMSDLWLGCEIFGFFSPLVPSKREKNLLVLLSLYIFWGKCVYFSIFEWLKFIIMHL